MLFISQILPRFSPSCLLLFFPFPSTAPLHAPLPLHVSLSPPHVLVPLHIPLPPLKFPYLSLHFLVFLFVPLALHVLLPLSNFPFPFYTPLSSFMFTCFPGLPFPCMLLCLPPCSSLILHASLFLSMPPIPSMLPCLLHAALSLPFSSGLLHAPYLLHTSCPLASALQKHMINHSTWLQSVLILNLFTGQEWVI